MDEKTEIKACPNCGGRAVELLFTKEPNSDTGAEQVKCQGCEMRGPLFEFEWSEMHRGDVAQDVAQSAIAAWNAIACPQEWISVEEELPEEYTVVWVRQRDEIDRGFLCNEGRTWEVQPFKSAYYELDARKPFSITHWRPIRHPPIPRQTPKEAAPTEDEIAKVIKVAQDLPDALTSLSEGIENALHYLKHLLDKLEDRNA